MKRTLGHKIGIMKMSFTCFAIALTLSLVTSLPHEKEPDYWYRLSKSIIDRSMHASLRRHSAKNVILFIGDGMGLNTITAGRILVGQRKGNTGEETQTALDRFSNVGLAKVYTIDKQTPDSAGTATAILSGTKTNQKLIGVSGKAIFKNCSSSIGNEVASILENSAEMGKSTGIVTTTQVQHATPAAAYAHSPSRSWMTDSAMSDKDRSQGCKDIALQLIEKGRDINVILGGGRAYMRPKGTPDEEYLYRRAGKRKDGRNLINEWLRLFPQSNARYVWNSKEFNAINPSTTDYLLGLFQPGAMHFEDERPADVAGEPSIKEMTMKAIDILNKNNKGYFLLVEGGKIDHAHHGNQANMALSEFAAFNEAIEAAIEMTDVDETLIVVTADHGHVFTVGGYTDRGNPISGFARTHSDPELASDGKIYTSLAYGNGPGFRGNSKGDQRENVTNRQTDDPRHRFQTAVPLPFESHSAEDTAVLARGPMAHLFNGLYEQSYIGYAMMFASCVGLDKSLCHYNLTKQPASYEIRETAKDMKKLKTKQQMQRSTVPFTESKYDASDVQYAISTQSAILADDGSRFVNVTSADVLTAFTKTNSDHFRNQHSAHKSGISNISFSFVTPTVYIKQTHGYNFFDIAEKATEKVSTNKRVEEAFSTFAVSKASSPSPKTTTNHNPDKKKRRPNNLFVNKTSSESITQYTFSSYHAATTHHPLTTALNRNMYETRPKLYGFNIESYTGSVSKTHPTPTNLRLNTSPPLKIVWNRKSSKTESTSLTNAFNNKRYSTSLSPNSATYTAETTLVLETTLRSSNLTRENTQTSVTTLIGSEIISTVETVTTQKADEIIPVLPTKSSLKVTKTTYKSNTENNGNYLVSTTSNAVQASNISTGFTSPPRVTITQPIKSTDSQNNVMSITDSPSLMKRIVESTVTVVDDTGFTKRWQTLVSVLLGYNLTNVFGLSQNSKKKLKFYKEIIERIDEVLFSESGDQSDETINITIQLQVNIQESKYQSIRIGKIKKMSCTKVQCRSPGFESDLKTSNVGTKIEQCTTALIITSSLTGLFFVSMCALAAIVIRLRQRIIHFVAAKE